MRGRIDRLEPAVVGASPGVATGVAILSGSIPRRVARYPRLMSSSPPRLVWSEIRDLLDMTGCADVTELIGALEAYRDDPPLPNEPVEPFE